MKTTWKRLSAILLCIAMLLSMMPAIYAEEISTPATIEGEPVTEEVAVVEESVAEEPAAEEFVAEISESAERLASSVVVSGACGENLTWVLDDEGTLTISGTGEMNLKNGDSWDNYSDDIINVVIEDGVTTIGAWAFSECSSLTSVTIGDGVTTIGAYAFYNCDSLTSVTIGDSVTTIGDRAFFACENLMAIQVSENNTAYMSLDGVLFTKDQTELVQYPGGKIGDYVIPNKVTTIRNHAFFDCAGLTGVTIDGSVITIGEDVFYSCDSLTSVTIGDSVTTIGQGAFYWCENLTSVTIGDSVTTIGYMAFTDCYSLKSVTIGDGVTTIGAYAFYNCYSLTSVTIPDSVNTIGNFAFQDCENLQSVTIGNSVTTIGHSAFYDCDSLADVYYGGSESDWNAIEIGDDNECLTEAEIYYNYQGLVAPVIAASNVASSGKIKLTWDAVDGASKYQVYRATSKTGTYTRMYTTSGTSYTNTKATAGKYYYYYVVSVDADGNVSEPSNIVGRTCDLARPVIKLSNVVSTGKVKVTWDAVDGAVSYKVYRATSKTGKYSLMKTVTGTSYTNTKATAGKTYYYKVVAVAEKSAANSAYSAMKYRTCDLARPVVSIALNSKGKPKLSWSAVDGAVKYQIYRSTSKTGTYKLAYTAGSNSYTNSGAASGKTYYYKVIAVHSNTAANSAYSGVVSIKTK